MVQTLWHIRDVFNIFEITFPTFLKIDHVIYYLMGDKVNSPRILVKYKAEGHIRA